MYDAIPGGAIAATLMRADLDEASRAMIGHDSDLPKATGVATVSGLAEHPFIIPASALGEMTEMRDEYAFDALPKIEGLSILDIGAHVGMYSFFARQKWPDAEITAIEPHPHTFELLQKNVKPFGIRCLQAAVVGDWPNDWPINNLVKLYEGKLSSMECSVRHDLVWPGGAVGQDLSRHTMVKGMRAHELPPCDILKVDVEGLEEEILLVYLDMHVPECVQVEIHGDLETVGPQIHELLKSHKLVLKYVYRRTHTFVPEAEFDRW